MFCFFLKLLLSVLCYGIQCLTSIIFILCLFSVYTVMYRLTRKMRRCTTGSEERQWWKWEMILIVLSWLADEVQHLLVSNTAFHSYMKLWFLWKDTQLSLVSWNKFKQSSWICSFANLFSNNVTIECLLISCTISCFLTRCNNGQQLACGNDSWCAVIWFHWILKVSNYSNEIVDVVSVVYIPHLVV